MKICTYLTRKDETSPWEIRSMCEVPDDHTFGLTKTKTGLHIEGSMSQVRLEKFLYNINDTYNTGQ